MADAELEQALTPLWQLPRPGPDNLLAAPAFVALSELCLARYEGGKAVFALSTALRSLGLPCALPKAQAGLSLDIAAAAAALDRAFTQTRCVRRHLCPLDLADDLPPLAFGTTRLARFDAGTLNALFDAPKLARNIPTIPLQADRLAQFHWLVVEEDVELDPRPEARSTPFLFTDMRRDLGEIEPHLGRFPKAVEDALVFLLLAPWEDWSTMQEVDWRGFRVPWIYTVEDDLFARPNRPPDVDSLTLEPWIVTDYRGEEIELEQPTALRLNEEAERGLARFDAAAWAEMERARASTLFETPVAHFLVRAFLADGMDEVMAHMTTIEAALGLEKDHKSKLRPKPDPHAGISATKRVAARLAALLSDPNAVQAYIGLFELRSTFVHGRGGVGTISTPQRVLARSLARRAARALVDLTAQPAQARSDVLDQLLDIGRQYL